MTDQPKKRMSPGILIRAYLNLRDGVLKEENARHKQATEEIEAKMFKIEQRFTAAFNKSIESQGEGAATTLITEFGRAQRDVRESYSMSDPHAYIQWILEDPETRVYALQKRIGAGVLDTIIEELTPAPSEEDPTPRRPDIPGVTIKREVRTKFIKPTQK